MTAYDPDTAVLKSRFSSLIGANVTSVVRIRGGRNTRVYKVISEYSRKYAGKLYFRHSADERDRLSAEFSGLRFLRENGVECVPDPIAADPQAGIGIYEYIEGKRIASHDVTENDVDQAVNFLGSLKQVRDSVGSRKLLPASEAGFSAQVIVDIIKTRLDRLVNPADKVHGHLGLREFLRDRFIGQFETIENWCRSRSHEVGLDWESEIGHVERTLSPSDFGFHNALYSEKCGIVFLDFEYFGWDDPAKLISDFLLHPAMELSEDLKNRFYKGMLEAFHDLPNLARRVEILYPLFGLKWCLIFLNEFIPDQMARRDFAAADESKIEAVQAEQLAKSKRMLQRIANEYEDFPYKGTGS